MITFEECQEAGYRSRTMANASADITMAIARNFDTAGEKLTRNCVRLLGKQYIALYLDTLLTQLQFKVAINQLENKTNYTLNIAGNGIYTLRDISQTKLDEVILHFLGTVFQMVENKPTLIRSGGQTGVDEAGLKAAVKLGIPAYCLAPKNWAFRNRDGQDVYDEYRFKQRFI